MANIAPLPNFAKQWEQCITTRGYPYAIWNYVKKTMCITVFSQEKSLPKTEANPEIKRTGFNKAFYGQKPLDMFRTLLTDSRAETLLKTGQTPYWSGLWIWVGRIDNYWQSIRICIRNGYKINDATL